MTRVWDIDLPDSDKIVLLALADCANDEGHCWPSVASLVRKCSKSERTIQASIKRLVDEGYLIRREVIGKGCNYTVLPRVRESNETHYIYRSENPATGEFYVGARTCFGPPQEDDYVGSGEWVKQQVGQGVKLTKSVLSTHHTRDELAIAEKAATSAVFGQPLCKNRKIATPATLSGRKDCGAQGTTQTPAAAADKPSRTITTEAKASFAETVDRVVSAWNAMAVANGLSQVRVMDASRKQSLRLRIKSVGLEAILEAIDIMGRSDWLKGEGRKGNWRPTIDFILQPESLRKLLEGSYGGAEKPRTAPRPLKPHEIPNAIRFWTDQGNVEKVAELKALLAETLRAAA